MFAWIGGPMQSLDVQKWIWNHWWNYKAPATGYRAPNVLFQFTYPWINFICHLHHIWYPEAINTFGIQCNSWHALNFFHHTHINTNHKMIVWKIILRTMMNKDRERERNRTMYLDQMYTNFLNIYCGLRMLMYPNPDIKIKQAGSSYLHLC